MELGPGDESIYIGITHDDGDVICYFQDKESHEYSDLTLLKSLINSAENDSSHFNDSGLNLMLAQKIAESHGGKVYWQNFSKNKFICYLFF